MRIDNAELDHILTTDDEQLLVREIFMDGRIIPREIVPTLIDVFCPDENGITYALGYVYSTEDSMGFSESYMIAGRRYGNGPWVWAWLESGDGTIISDIEEGILNRDSALCFLGEDNNHTTYGEF